MLHGEETVIFRMNKAARHHFENLSKVVSTMSVLFSGECHNKAMKCK